MLPRFFTQGFTEEVNSQDLLSVYYENPTDQTQLIQFYSHWN